MVSGHWESVLFICQKGLQKQHGVIPWRCIELIRLFELPAKRQRHQATEELATTSGDHLFASWGVDKETPGWRILCPGKIQNPIDRAEFSQPALPFPDNKKNVTSVRRNFQP